MAVLSDHELRQHFGEIRSLYSEACHGAGAEPRREARAKLSRKAEELGEMSDASLLARLGFNLSAYFASRPIS
jgi:predicted HicB family RNase H-like nuclease